LGRKHRNLTQQTPACVATPWHVGIPGIPPSAIPLRKIRKRCARRRFLVERTSHDCALTKFHPSHPVAQPRGGKARCSAHDRRLSAHINPNRRSVIRHVDARPRCKKKGYLSGSRDKKLELMNRNVKKMNSIFNSFPKNMPTYRIDSSQYTRSSTETCSRFPWNSLMMQNLAGDIVTW
jgi:hypothetical protein